MKRITSVFVLAVFALFSLTAEDILFSKNDRVQAVLFQHKGLFVSTDSGITWTDRSAGLPAREVYPDYGNGIKTFSSLAVGMIGDTETVILAATHNALYRSVNGGAAWERVPLGAPVKPADYLTAVAGHPDKPDTILLGTSYSGLLETADGGKTWRRLDDKLKALYRGAGFYEEILGLAYESEDSADGSERTVLPFISTGYTKETFKLGNAELEKIEYQAPIKPANADLETLRGLFPLLSEREKLFHADNTKIYENRKGIYVNSIQAGSEKIDAHLDFLAKKGLNCLVVDFKDDTGLVTYDTALEAPRTYGAVRERIRLDDLVSKVHSHGMYLIGRIVVFKDQRLYQHPGFAIMDKDGGKWGNRVKVEKEDETVWEQREFWVDPFNPKVWDYNAAIAKELQDRGVDEIQFDYIRFPSDGDTSRAVYPAQREGMTRTEALESFLVRVREDIRIPVSTDLYGFNSWYRMGNWIGQSLDLVSRYVDVICPMFYPSHFPRDFLKGLEYKARAERIYQEGCNRAAAIVGDKAVIRPYVQAFLLPFEYYMEEPEYTEYLRLQVKGTEESAATGFLLWNNSNRYYMVTDTIKEYTAKANQEKDTLD